MSFLQGRVARATIVALTATGAFGKAELHLTDDTNDPTVVEIAPGEGFDVYVGLGTADGLVGLSYWLTISDAGSGKFSLKRRVIADECPLKDLITQNAGVLEAAAALLDPRNDRDLGGIAEDLFSEPAPGIYPMAMITIQSAADVAVGTYTLTPTNVTGSTATGADVQVVPHAYTIVVVAPGTETGNDTGGDSGGGMGSGDTGGTGTDTGNNTGTDTGAGGNTDGAGTGTGNDTGTDNAGGNTGSGPTGDHSGSTGGSSDGPNDDTANETAGTSPAICGRGILAAVAPMLLGLSLMRRRR